MEAVIIPGTFKVLFEQRPDGWKGVKHVYILREDSSGERKQLVQRA